MQIELPQALANKYNLRRLYFTGAGVQVDSDNTIMNIINKCPQLQYIDLSKVPMNPTLADNIHAKSKDHPDLEIIWPLCYNDYYDDKFNDREWLLGEVINTGGDDIIF